MESYNKTLLQFNSDVASSAPYPGGGGVSALVLALASSLANMVGSLTIGKAKYADVEDEIKQLNQRCQTIQNKALSLIDADAECFKPLSQAYHLDKNDPNRDVIMEKALLTAVSVPLEILDICKETIDIAQIYASKGSKLALSDAGCAISLALSALDCASLNVYINTKMMKNEMIKEKINNQTDNIIKECHLKGDKLFKDIESRLR